jgi:hypothetical protein
MLTSPDTMATSTTTGTTTTDSSQDDGTIMHVDSLTPLSSTLPSFVVYNKGLMEEERDEGISKSLLSLWELGNTSRLWMRRDDDNDDDVGAEYSSFWSSPFNPTKRLQDGDKNSFLNYHGIGTVQDDTVDDELVPSRIILRDDYEETRNHNPCDSPLHGHITDFGQALTYNTNVAIANAELMHRVVENIQMDYSYDFVEEEEEVIEYDSEDDEDLSLLRYDFVRLDHFHQDRVQEEEEPQDDLLITTTTLDNLLEEEEEAEKTYDLEQESYATQMFLEYERERHFIVAQIEPACNEMKYMVDSLDNDCDHEYDDDEYDDSIKNRWYAQISSNIHGIYYYQPSTGNISRSEPFSYMDTSQVRCFGCHYSSTRKKEFVGDDKEHKCIWMILLWTKSL